MITLGQHVEKFVIKACGGTSPPTASFAVGNLDSNRRLVGGVLFDHYNGATIEMHVAGKPGWLTRKFIRKVFEYAFDYANANKIIGRISSANKRSLQLALKFGFCHEATIKDGMPDGDLLLVTLTREQCKWLKSGENHGRKLQDTSNHGLEPGHGKRPGLWSGGCNLSH